MHERDVIEYEEVDGRPRLVSEINCFIHIKGEEIVKKPCRNRINTHLRIVKHGLSGITKET